MADVKDSDVALLIVDLIDDPKIADTQAPPIAACQLEGSCWSGVIRKQAHCIADTNVCGRI
jgi:hypothetical protein